MTKILGDVKQWFNDKGDYTHRLNYDLNNNSIVFDPRVLWSWTIFQAIAMAQIMTYFSSKIRK